jgi:hypothetical protein
MVEADCFDFDPVELRGDGLRNERGSRYAAIESMRTTRNGGCLMTTISLS